MAAFSIMITASNVIAPPTSRALRTTMALAKKPASGGMPVSDSRNTVMVRARTVLDSPVLRRS